MKKLVLLIGVICLVLSLIACQSNAENDNVSNQSKQESDIEEESKSNEEKETPSDTTSNEDEYETETEADAMIVPEEITADAIIDGIDMDNPPINWGTPDGPEIATENYYVSKKGGELVDPNRTIELRYEDGTWNVVNEGY